MSTVDTRTDTKGRQQPAHKAPAPTKAEEPVASADTAPTYTPEPPVVKTIAYQRLEPEPPAVKTITYERREVEDPAKARIKSAAAEVSWGLSAIASALATHSTGPILAALTDDERREARKDIEAVDQLKAALDAPANVVPFPDKKN